MKKNITAIIKSTPLYSFIRDVRLKIKFWYLSQMKEEQYPRFLKRWYKRKTGKTLNLENPRTFNEKIQWLKLYDSTPPKTMLADKYRVRQWVAEKIGEEYLKPLLGVWENANSIDFNALPDQFILKTNHGSRWNIIVRDKNKLNIDKTRTQLNKWLKLNLAFMSGLELHYKNIPPKIIAEAYITEFDGDLHELEIFCFNGEPKTIWVETGIGTPEQTRNIYDAKWNLLPILIDFPPLRTPLKKPHNIEKILDMARMLSDGFAHVRVDFYYLRGIIYFGEMTFTTYSGILNIPENYCNELGDWLKLPEPTPFERVDRHTNTPCG